jgi:hypothetical protein
MGIFSELALDKLAKKGKAKMTATMLLSKLSPS